MPKKSHQRQERLARRQERRLSKGRRQGNVVDLNSDVRFANRTLEEPTVLKTTFEPKTEAQYHYAHLIDKCDIVFGTGSAGTGKTHTAVAKAALEFIEGRIKRIIITRPVLEAKGEGGGLGFLPGTVEEKAAPYMAPVQEILRQYFTPSHLEYLMKVEKVMFVPLEYMRGRTFNSAYVIVDEAQNTTPEQMKLVLTRLGHYSKAILCGDTTQTDIKRACLNGLDDAVKRFAGKLGFGHYDFSPDDIVRKDIVRQVILGYQG